MGAITKGLGPAVHGTDVALLRLAHSNLTKAVEAAVKALDVLQVESDELDTRASEAVDLGNDLDGNVDRTEFELRPTSAEAADLGCGMVLAKLQRLRDAQLDLLVPVSEIDQQIATVTELRAKLRTPAAAPLFDEVES